MNTDSLSCIYLDNAATTPLDPLVLEAMVPYWNVCYGNPSSVHRLGNQAKVAIERARRLVMDLLQAGEGQIFFTSGGTESNNWAIKGLVMANGIQHVITSPIEHLSVLNSIKCLKKHGNIAVHFVDLDQRGDICYDSLASLLKAYPNSLVSLMHGNNELGNITDIQQVGALCRERRALFHTDMVQTVGYYPINLTSMPIDACTISAHKLYGPKGVGALYVKNKVKITPLIHGGSQERKLRSGTENTPLIVGLAKALAIAVGERDENYSYLQQLKSFFIEQLKLSIPNVGFNGQCDHLEKSLPSIVNVSVPGKKYHNDTLLFYLELANICASEGSACMSGAEQRSHVLRAVGMPENRPTVRFSLGKNNNLQELKKVIKKIATW